MSLYSELRAAMDDLWADALPGARDRYERALADVRAGGVVEEALQGGEMIPEFDLPDRNGRSVSLDVLLDRGPLVIVFRLSDRCPLCQRAVAAYRRIFVGREGGIVAVSATGAWAGRSDETAPGQLDAGDPVLPLADPAGRLAGLFGLLYLCPEELRSGFERLGAPPAAATPVLNLPLAATYVVGADGIAAFAHVDPDPVLRPEPAALIAALDRL